MADRPLTGLYSPRPRHLVVQDLVQRAQRRMAELSDSELQGVLEDALFHERKRLERAPTSDPERRLLDELARALVRGDRTARTAAATKLGYAWAMSSIRNS